MQWGKENTTDNDYNPGNFLQSETLSKDQVWKNGCKNRDQVGEDICPADPDLFHGFCIKDKWKGGGKDWEAQERNDHPFIGYDLYKGGEIKKNK